MLAKSNHLSVVTISCLEATSGWSAERFFLRLIRLHLCVIVLQDHHEIALVMAKGSRPDSIAPDRRWIESYF